MTAAQKTDEYPTEMVLELSGQNVATTSQFPITTEAWRAFRANLGKRDVYAVAALRASTNELTYDARAILDLND